MQIKITRAEKEALETQHKKERDGRVKDRIKAVLLCSEGWSSHMIAQALRIHETTVNMHLNEYTTSEKLKPENGGSTGHLKKEQTEALIEHLMEKTYPSTKEIRAYVLDAYGVTYTQQGMHDWLIAHNFSFKKPKEASPKCDVEKQKEFIKTYEDLKQNTPQNEPILFMDSVHPTMATKVTSGWIRKGQNKVIATSASRTRENITGAIELSEMYLFRRHYETINGESTVDFFKLVEASYPDAPQIHIILDQSGYHTCKEVHDYVEHSRIHLIFLPPYSPNLNPIERVWKIMNKTVRNNRFFESAKHFRSAIHDFFDIKFNQIRMSIVDTINDNFQILKPGSSF